LNPFNLIALMMVAASTSETSINFCETTRRNNPEDSHLRTRRRENLKANDLFVVFIDYSLKTKFLIHAVTMFSL
jgi:hypothetical protein